MLISLIFREILGDFNLLYLLFHKECESKNTQIESSRIEERFGGKPEIICQLVPRFDLGLMI